MAPRKKYPKWKGQGRTNTNSFRLQGCKEQECEEVEELKLVGRNITIRAGSNVITESSKSKDEVAKILALFKNPVDDNHFWAKVLWFYSADYIAQECRPQVHRGKRYTSTSFIPFKQEIFASKHVDYIPAWSIHDVAHVLTYNSYQREMARRCHNRQNIKIPSGLYRGDFLDRKVAVDSRISSDKIFFCRHIFNPTSETILGFVPKELPGFEHREVVSCTTRRSARNVAAKAESTENLDISKPVVTSNKGLRVLREKNKF